MSLLIYPVYRNEVRAAKTRTTGEFLAAEFETIDEIAEAHDLTPMTAFADQRAVPVDFDGPPWELDEVLGPCEDWYPAQEGSDALSALAKLIKTHPKVAKQLEAPDAVIEELEDLARQLALAAKKGAGFRLAMS